MSNKALISELTWRSLEMQRAAFPDMPQFIGPHEIPNLLRPTTRKQPLNIHVISLGVIANKEADFIEFAKTVRKSRAHIVEKETSTNYWPKCPLEDVVKAWRAARKHGVQKIGGKVSAEKREAEAREACSKIEERWALPSKTWRTPVLLKEAGVSYNTAVKYLDPRPRVQYNHQAKLKRKVLREQRAN